MELATRLEARMQNNATAYDYEKQCWVFGEAGADLLRKQAIQSIEVYEKGGHAALLKITDPDDSESRQKIIEAAHLARTAGWGFAANYLAGLA